MSLSNSTNHKSDTQLMQNTFIFFFLLGRLDHGISYFLGSIFSLAHSTSSILYWLLWQCPMMNFKGWQKLRHKSKFFFLEREKNYSFRQLATFCCTYFLNIPRWYCKPSEIEKKISFLWNFKNCKRNSKLLKLLLLPKSLKSLYKQV